MTQEAHPRQPRLRPLGFQGFQAVLLLALGLTVPSCSSKPNKPVPPPPITLGTPLTPAGIVLGGSDLAWSSFTNEVYFFRSDFTTSGVSYPDGTIRHLDDNAILLGLSPDGHYLYYVFIGPDFLDLKLIRFGLPNGTTRDTIYDPALDYRLSRGGDLVAFAATAFSANVDSLYLYRIATHERQFLTLGVPVAFSPDGQQLLYRSNHDDPAGATLLFDLNSSTSTSMPLGVPDTSTAYAVRWDETGLRVPFSVDHPSRLFLRDVTHGSVTLLLQTTDSLITTRPAWSNDGTKLAFTTNRYYRDSAPGLHRESSVWVVNLLNHEATLLARGQNTDVGGSPAPEDRVVFSPDGHTLAYVVGERIFTKAVP